MNWLLWALVAWCKDMKGVDVGYQLLDSIHQARDCARGEEKCHEEEVEAEKRLPVPLVQWPAQQNSTHLFVVCLSRTFLALHQNTKLPTDIKQLMLVPQAVLGLSFIYQNRPFPETSSISAS